MKYTLDLRRYDAFPLSMSVIPSPHSSDEYKVRNTKIEIAF